jgi:hypothetical protein
MLVCYGLPCNCSNIWKLAGLGSAWPNDVGLLVSGRVRGYGEQDLARTRSGSCACSWRAPRVQLVFLTAALVAAMPSAV